MDISFKGNVWLVSGGAGGIGFKAARMYAEVGASVAVTDINGALLR